LIFSTSGVPREISTVLSETLTPQPGLGVFGNARKSVAGYGHGDQNGLIGSIFGKTDFVYRSDFHASQSDRGADRQTFHVLEPRFQLFFAGKNSLLAAHQEKGHEHYDESQGNQKTDPDAFG
jgi:hypothetical protein